MSAWGAVSIYLPITGRGAFMTPILRIGGVLAVLAVNTTMENTTVQRRLSMSDKCECRLDNDYLTLCDEHKLELENLKNNPPLWAIRARRGK